jgi:hypothetical protein
MGGEKGFAGLKKFTRSGDSGITADGLGWIGYLEPACDRIVAGFTRPR